MKDLIEGKAIPLLPIPQGECLKRTERLHIGDRFNVPAFAHQATSMLQDSLGIKQNQAVYLIFLQGVLSILHGIQSNYRNQPDVEVQQ